MDPQKEKDLWTSLFTAISLDTDNENEIIKTLDANKNNQNLKEIINKIDNSGCYEESMLMWAVWRMKKSVIIKLLDLGANQHFSSNFGESVSTYWNDSTIKEKGEDMAFEIAEILHQKGVNLERDSCNSYSIVRRARVHNFNVLSEKFKQLGYQ